MAKPLGDTGLIGLNRPMAAMAVFLLLLSMGATAGLEGCSGPSAEMPVENAAYYWRTTWHLDSTETAFLGEHGIGKLYCRYFDVVMRDGKPMPNATLRLPEASSSPTPPAVLPQGLELIPTVYITEDCMRTAPADGWEQLAQRLVGRIVQMNTTHGLPPARELQVDCDYTLRSRQTYYDFLDRVREETRRHAMRLSVTIRLHQLSMPAPPADYGVLMIYNTGDPRNFAERNPILDIRDVQPYMRYLPDYPLPLAGAYPVYRWRRKVGNVNIEHSVEAAEILRVKKLVERTRPDMGHTIIIYSLDKENIDRYDNDTFSKIYHH